MKNNAAKIQLRKFVKKIFLYSKKIDIQVSNFRTKEITINYKTKVFKFFPEYKSKTFWLFYKDQTNIELLKLTFSKNDNRKIRKIIDHFIFNR